MKKNLGRGKVSQSNIKIDNLEKNLGIVTNLFLQNKNQIQRYLKDTTENQKKFWTDFFNNNFLIWM